MALRPGDVLDFVLMPNAGDYATSARFTATITSLGDAGGSLSDTAPGRPVSRIYFPPFLPSPIVLSPNNGATGVSTTPTLTWTTSEGATDYDVFFGTTFPLPRVATADVTSYSPPQLTQGTTYYWYVDATGQNYLPGTSFQVSFTTFSPVPPPAAPVLTSPSTTSDIAVTNGTALHWTAASGADSYDVYLGPSSPPPLVVNTTELSYGLFGLLPENIYHWQIVAKNAGGSTPSPVWTFATGFFTNPVAPDFNGDGNADVYLYDPLGGNGYAALSNGFGGFAYVYSPFSPGFDVIRYGDVNGDGKTDLIAYNSTSTIGYVLLGTETGTFSGVSLFWGQGYKTVATGDLNGDGLADFVLYRASDGTMYTAISNGDGTFRYQYTLVSSGFTNLQVTDFSGDGKADVLFYRSTDGLAYLGISNGTGGFTFSPVSLLPGYTSIETGDVNGDGKADVLLYSPTSGATAVGLSTGSGFSFTSNRYSAGFTTVKLLDFNGDGKADVVFYNMNTAIGYLGVSDGAGNFTFNSLFWGPGFDTVDTLDLNGGGRAA